MIDYIYNCAIFLELGTLTLQHSKIFIVIGNLCFQKEVCFLVFMCFKVFFVKYLHTLCYVEYIFIKNVIVLRGVDFYSDLFCTCMVIRPIVEKLCVEQLVRFWNTGQYVGLIFE